MFPLRTQRQCVSRAVLWALELRPGWPPIPWPSDLEETSVPLWACSHACKTGIVPVHWEELPWDAVSCCPWHGTLWLAQSKDWEGMSCFSLTPQSPGKFKFCLWPELQALGLSSVRLHFPSMQYSFPFISSQWAWTQAAPQWASQACQIYNPASLLARPHNLAIRSFSSPLPPGLPAYSSLCLGHSPALLPPCPLLS